MFRIVGFWTHCITIWMAGGCLVGERDGCARLLSLHTSHNNINTVSSHDSAISTVKFA